MFGTNFRGFFSVWRLRGGTLWILIVIIAMAITYIPFFHPKIDRQVERYADSSNLWAFARFVEHPYKGYTICCKTEMHLNVFVVLRRNCWHDLIFLLRMWCVSWKSCGIEKSELSESAAKPRYFMSVVCLLKPQQFSWICWVSLPRRFWHDAVRLTRRVNGTTSYIIAACICGKFSWRITKFDSNYNAYSVLTTLHLQYGINDHNWFIWYSYHVMNCPWRPRVHQFQPPL